jgi:hypothetical protein
MMASDDVTTDGNRMVSRADIAKLTLRLRAAQHEAEQAEANLAQAGSPDDARSAVRQRVDPLIEARREALAQQLEQARAEADAGLMASRAAAARMIASSRQELADAEAESAERAQRLLAEEAARQAAEEQMHRDAEDEAARLAAEEAARLEAEELARAEDEAARLAAEEAARLEAEEAARLEAEEAARLEAEAEEAARLAEEEAARLEAEAAERAARFEAEEAARREEDAHPLTPTLVESVPQQVPPAPQVIPIPLSSHTPTVEEQADATLWGPPAPSPLHVPAQAAVGPLPPTQVLLDAEAFARVFTNVVAQMLDERLPRMQYPQYPQYQQMPSVIVQAAPQPAPQPQRSAASNARHLDVILAGVAMVIVLMVLAAWLV